MNEFSKKWLEENLAICDSNIAYAEREIAKERDPALRHDWEEYRAFNQCRKGQYRETFEIFDRPRRERKADTAKLVFAIFRLLFAIALFALLIYVGKNCGP